MATPDVGISPEALELKPETQSKAPFTTGSAGDKHPRAPDAQATFSIPRLERCARKSDSPMPPRWMPRLLPHHRHIPNGELPRFPDAPKFYSNCANSLTRIGVVWRN